MLANTFVDNAIINSAVYVMQVLQRGMSGEAERTGLTSDDDVVELVPIPTDENISEMQIRDSKDRPILRATIAAKADILLTGDKDFLESGLKNPVIMTPAEFLKIKQF